MIQSSYKYAIIRSSYKYAMIQSSYKHAMIRSSQKQFFCRTNVISGDKYIGDWLKGEMHGDGIKSQSDGSVLEGIRK